MIYGLRNILKTIKHFYCLGELNNSWRKKNQHNYTTITRRCDFSNVHVGNYTYGQLNIHDFKVSNSLSIGNFCSIADDVHFYLAGGHNLETISTYPFKKNIFAGKPESLSKGDIVVEDDVWIGSRVLVLSGVTIGRGSVIAAGAVVTRDIPPYTIAAGVPAKVIKNRFTPDVVEALKRVNYSNLDKVTLKQYIEDLYLPVDNMNAEELAVIIQNLNHEDK